MRRFRALTLVALAGLSGACATSRPHHGEPTPAELTVFAAASLTEPFKRIGDDFGTAHGGVRVTFNFGGSQQLAQQLAQGAPADVFASANQKQMDAVVGSGRIEKDTARDFVRNRLVVVTPKDNPGHVAKLEDVSTPGLKLILAAKEVPVGQYTLEMLDKAEKQEGAGAGFRDAILKNVVSYEQDVKAVLTKVMLGEADAGIVYASDIAQEAKDKVTRIDVPEAVNVIASYPIAVVKGGNQTELAKKFVGFVCSPAAQTVLVTYGFISTAGGAASEAPTAAPVDVVGSVVTPLTLGRVGKRAAFSQVDAPDGDKTVKRLPIAILLDKIGGKLGAASVALVGSDGSRKESPLEEARTDAQASVTVGENGSCRSVVPSTGPDYGMKGLVKIDAS